MFSTVQNSSIMTNNTDDNEMVAFSLQCNLCDTIHNIVLPVKDLVKWQEGALIQDAMGYLDPDIRELMISGVCGECFDRMFGEEKE